MLQNYQKNAYLPILACIQNGLHLHFLYIKRPFVGQNVALCCFMVWRKGSTFA